MRNLLMVLLFVAASSVALAELPDREGALPRAVASEDLLGTTVDFAGQRGNVDCDGWVA